MAKRIRAVKGDMTREFTEAVWESLPLAKDGTRNGWKAQPKSASKAEKKAETTTDAGADASTDGDGYNNQDVVLLAKDGKADDAITHIKTLESDEDIDAYMKGEKRPTVKAAAEKRKEELAGAGAGE